MLHLIHSYRSRLVLSGLAAAVVTRLGSCMTDDALPPTARSRRLWACSAASWRRFFGGNEVVANSRQFRLDRRR